ncbi:MAG: hypothetical protein A2288_00015 [Candidatus Moranbacteria bacterium RIFOXYA12_FULL_44_15]|nr:MAG: hypothetical protein A2288_00015 [Candidatus Moranbacteria bacterium RIFOXYA12_FULL_44_15]OGI35569.1 MAG: hypothetical protein A2259_00385 [Candidatus Moranbacteria bacterium RIFOXYA2_FULL_43_15]
MSRVITLNNFGAKNFVKYSRKTVDGRAPRGRVFSVDEKKEKRFSSGRNFSGNSQVSFTGYVFLLLSGVIVSGVFYLYQVNDLATKGYDIKEAEVRIQNLERENKKMQIREVELRSMYNIENATEDLDLVSSSKTDYLEADGSVAMK